MKNIATYIKSYFESCKNIQTFQMGRKKKDEEGEDEHLVVLNGEIGLVNEKGFQSKSNFTFEYNHKVVCLVRNLRGYSLQILHKSWQHPREMFAYEEQLKSPAKFLHLLEEEVPTLQAYWSPFVAPLRPLKI